VPQPAGGAYSAPPDPLAGFMGPTSKERRVREGREGKGEWKEQGRGWQKEEGKAGVRDLAPP